MPTRTYLQVDLLPEIAQSPRVLTDYMAALTERGIRPRVDSYITSKQPQDLPSLLPSALIIPATAGSATSTYNLPLITSLVVRTITCTYWIWCHCNLSHLPTSILLLLTSMSNYLFALS